MTFQIPPVYPITSVPLSGLTHPEQVRRLIAGGAKLIQVRDKDAAPKDLYQAVAKCIELCRAAGTKLIVNDRVDIAIAAGADGVHLGQEDMPAGDARRLLGPDKIIGVSTHDLEQLTAARELPVDYLAVGPVFSTSTKENPDPVVGLEFVAKAKTIAGRLPLVAIGGISTDRFPDVLRAGADSAAMISSILSEPDHIETKVEEFLRLSLTVKHS